MRIFILFLIIINVFGQNRVYTGFSSGVGNNHIASEFFVGTGKQEGAIGIGYAPVIGKNGSPTEITYNLYMRWRLIKSNKFVPMLGGGLVGGIRTDAELELYEYSFYFFVFIRARLLYKLNNSLMLFLEGGFPDYYTFSSKKIYDFCSVGISYRIYERGK